jgi:hypothetical protein
MHSSITVLLFLWTTHCLGQSNFNQIRNITKKEFKKLKEERGRFIPLDLAKNKVLLIIPSSEKFDELERKANVTALHLNGFDTTHITNNEAFARNNSEYYADFDKTYFRMIERLKKKGYTPEPIHEGTENNYSIEDFRYLIKLDFVSTMWDPEKSYFVKPTYCFVDRLNNKNYEVFLPLNFYIWELIDKN